MLHILSRIVRKETITNTAPTLLREDGIYRIRLHTGSVIGRNEPEFWLRDVTERRLVVLQRKLFASRARLTDAKING